MNYNIKRVGSYGVISPIPEGRLAKTLEKYMSYERQGKEFMPNPAWATVRLYKIKKGIFPWGFRKLVKKIFDAWVEKECRADEYNWNFYVQSLPRKTFIENIEIGFDLFSNTELREYQQQAVAQLLIQDGGVVSMPTGSGKTKTAIEWLKILDVDSLVIVTTLDIKKQWEKQTIGTKIKVINWQSPLVESLVMNAEAIVFDECHHVSAKSIFNAAMRAKTNCKLAGFSATPNREDGEDMRIQGALGEVIFEISRKDLIKQGFLANAKVLYVSSDFEVSFDDKFLKYADIYKKHIVDNWYRNELIVNLATIHAHQGRKVLVLVSQIDHGHALYNGILANKKIYLHGGSDKSEREQDLSEFNVIVASNIFNEGVDLPALDVLIIAAGGKSSIQLTQRIGRVLRPKLNGREALIIDFIDIPKFLNEHYKKRRAILEKDFEVIEHDNVGK